MKRLTILLTILLGILFTHTGLANYVPPTEPQCLPPTLPTLDEIIIGGGGSPLVTNIKPLVGITESGMSWVNLPTTSLTETMMATILLEEAGYKNQNLLGIYKFNGPGVAPSASEMLLLFNGIDGVSKSATITFYPQSGIAWYDKNADSIKEPGETANIGSTFGLYLVSPDSASGLCHSTFYTDELLNPDTHTIEHGLIYDIHHITGAIRGNPNVVVAFEDLLAHHADWDYDDMVISATGVTPVPEPATVMLLGLGYLALLKKRR